MIDRAADFFPVIAAPAAILFGLGITMMIIDYLASLFGGRAGSDDVGETLPRPSRRGRVSRGRRQTSWRDEPYVVSNSWDELRDNARRVNNYKG